MSCPTCDHTMHHIGGEDRRHFWCPRCGTIVTVVSETFTDTTKPKLVERCRTFQDEVLLEGVANTPTVSAWVRLGIMESINTPSERPPV